MRQTIKTAIADAMAQAHDTIAYRIQEAIMEAAMNEDGTIDDDRHNAAIEEANRTMTAGMIASEAVHAAMAYGNITEEDGGAWERHPNAG